MGSKAFLFLGLIFSTLFVVPAGGSTWDFRSSSSTPSTSNGSGLGNLRTFTSGGVIVTVTSWGLTGNGLTTFQTAQTGRWGTGLGICNALEGAGCGDPAHQADNAYQYEFALFLFSAPLELIAITIDPFGAWDRDVTYYTGTNVSSSVNLTGVSLAGLAGLGFSGPTHNDSTASADPRSVVINGSGLNAVLFGARLGGDSYVDRFKIQSMTASLSEDPIPEPATFVMIGTALVGLGCLRRVRRSKDRLKTHVTQ